MNRAQTASEASSTSLSRSISRRSSFGHAASFASAASTLRPWRPSASARAEASSYSSALMGALADCPERDRGGRRLTEFSCRSMLLTRFLLTGDHCRSSPFCQRAFRPYLAQPFAALDQPVHEFQLGDDRR